MFYTYLVFIIVYIYAIKINRKFKQIFVINVQKCKKIKKMNMHDTCTDDPDRPLPAN